ncbi:MAG: peptide chain release factor 1 [Firmicutes bacterium]|jgi:peptide chain release factor 1|nr:peptide chain release factor 1 [Bacillota bacterium]
MYENLEGVRLRYEDISRELASPEAAKDLDRYRKLTREQAQLAPLVETYEAYQRAQKDLNEAKELMGGEGDEELKALAKDEFEEAKERSQELEGKLRILLVPKDPDDDRSVILEIRAGAGGDEAALFAAEVFRMYNRYAERKGWKVSVVDSESIGIGGLKFVSFMVEGAGAYGYLKYESGVHRVQRVPETESQGRIHTSTITVAAMPEVDDDITIDIPPEDIRIDITRASGNGGQGVNTTDSAVRLTHYPTGIVIYSQTERSQLQNKNKAFALLRAKLYELEKEKRHDAEADLRRSQIGTGDRSEKIRTYNFPQSRVTDHRIHYTTHNIGGVMNGDLDELIEALRTSDREAKLLKMDEAK